MMVKHIAIPDKKELGLGLFIFYLYIVKFI